MGTLSDVVNRLAVERTSGQVMERMQPHAAPVYALDALAGTLTALAESMKDRKEPESVDLKGVESALKALAKAMNVKVDAPTVNVAAPTVNVAAPTVNVAAPNVEVLMPESGMCRFDVYRDERGLMKYVVAVPIKEHNEDEEVDIE